MKYSPDSLMVWLQHLNVDILSYEEMDHYPDYDLNDHEGVQRTINEWIRPRYMEWDEIDRQGMLEVLRCTDQWTDEDLRPVFDQCGTIGGEIEDVRRFVELLKEAFL